MYEVLDCDEIVEFFENEELAILYAQEYQHDHEEADVHIYNVEAAEYLEY